VLPFPHINREPGFLAAAGFRTLGSTYNIAAGIRPGEVALSGEGPPDQISPIALRSLVTVADGMVMMLLT